MRNNDLGIPADVLDVCVPSNGLPSSFRDAMHAFGVRHGFNEYRRGNVGMRWLTRRRLTKFTPMPHLDHDRPVRHADGRRGLIGYEYPRGGGWGRQPMGDLHRWATLHGLEFRVAAIGDCDVYAVLICEPAR